ncbi:MAG TPA: DUF6308 family protein [Solirubrobacteraceae bacterium]|jgi:hypothetical protein
MDPAYALEVEREDGELLLLDGLVLVRGFLAGDLSARPNGYNDRAGRGDREAISIDDIVLVNSTMRSRAQHARWQPIIDADQSWLARIPDNLDLIDDDNATWAAAQGNTLVGEAIERCIVPHIGLARATKVLHLKRPRAFPVLDELVLQMMGVPVPDKVETRVAAARRVTAALRREGRRNSDALKRIRDATATDRSRLSLIRVLDIALWFAHPVAGVDGTSRMFILTTRA